MKVEDYGVWTVENIGPKLASAYLAKNGPNRKVIAGRVAEYSQSIVLGQFKLTHQGIAFDMQGRLIDGQHRLEAVVKTGKPIVCFVFRWKVPCDMSAIDDGKARTIKDVGTIEGDSLNTTHVAVARKFLNKGNASWTNGMQKGRWTRREVLDTLAEHREAIDWAISKCGHDKGVGNANFVTVIAMAWYTRDRERLAECVEVVRSGVCVSDQNQAAVKIRDYLMSGPAIAGGKAQASLFRKCQSAVLAFLEYRQLKKLVETDGIVFPYPEKTE